MNKHIDPRALMILALMGAFLLVQFLVRMNPADTRQRRQLVVLVICLAVSAGIVYYSYIPQAPMTLRISGTTGALVMVAFVIFAFWLRWWFWKRSQKDD